MFIPLLDHLSQNIGQLGFPDLLQFVAHVQACLFILTNRHRSMEVPTMTRSTAYVKLASRYER